MCDFCRLEREKHLEKINQDVQRCAKNTRLPVPFYQCEKCNTIWCVLYGESNEGLIITRLYSKNYVNNIISKMPVSRHVNTILKENERKT